MVNPSRKGFSFENQICRQLSMWWTGGQRNDVFCRTRASGAFATMRIKSKKSAPYAGGDITFEDPIGQPLIDHFIFSVKRGYNDAVSILSFVDKNIKAAPTLFKWWNQVAEQKEQHGKKASLLIMRRDYCVPVLVLDTKEMLSLETWVGDYPYSQITVELKDQSLTLLNLQSFLTWVDPITIQAWMKQ